MARSIRRSRRPVPAAGPVRLRPPVPPAATAGALAALEGVGYLLADVVRRGEPLPGPDASWALDELRRIYRVVRALRPPVAA